MQLCGACQPATRNKMSKLQAHLRRHEAPWLHIAVRYLHMRQSVSGARPCAKLERCRLQFINKAAAHSAAWVPSTCLMALQPHTRTSTMGMFVPPYVQLGADPCSWTLHPKQLRKLVQSSAIP